MLIRWLAPAPLQIAVRVDRFARRGSGADLQLPASDCLLLLRFYHYHRLLHGQHLRRFRYCHLPERRRERVQELRPGEESGLALSVRCHSLR